MFAIAISYISASPLLSAASLGPPVAMTDARYEERRENMNLGHGIPNKMVINSPDLNISSAQASVMFAPMSREMGNDNNSATKYILNEMTVPGTDIVHQILQEWSIHEVNGKRTYTVLLRITDMNNLEKEADKRLYKHVVGFNCNLYEIVDKFVCVPKHCGMPPKPVPTPNVVCMHNYHEAAKVISHVFELSEGVQKKTLYTPTLYMISMKCIRQKIERLAVTGEEICYLEGFSSENEMTYQEYRDTLSDEWVQTEHGKFERVMTTETKILRSLVDTKEQTVEDLTDEVTDGLEDLEVKKITTVPADDSS